MTSATPADVADAEDDGARRAQPELAAEVLEPYRGGSPSTDSKKSSWALVPSRCKRRVRSLRLPIVRRITDRVYSPSPRSATTPAMIVAISTAMAV